MLLSSCPARVRTPAPQRPLPFRRRRGKPREALTRLPGWSPCGAAGRHCCFRLTCFRVLSPLGTALKQSAPGTVPTVGAGPAAGSCMMMPLRLFLTVCLFAASSLKTRLFFVTPSFNPFVDEHMGFPGGSVVENLPASAGDPGSIRKIPWRRE